MPDNRSIKLEVQVSKRIFKNKSFFVTAKHFMIPPFVLQIIFMDVDGHKNSARNEYLDEK